MDPVRLLIGVVPGFGGGKFEVDSDTTIPPAGNQTIGEIAKRLCSHTTPVFEMWDQHTEKTMREVMYAVYLAGYQRGVISGD